MRICKKRSLISSIRSRINFLLYNDNDNNTNNDDDNNTFGPKKSKFYLFYHLYYKLKAQHTLIHYLQYIFVAKGKKIYTYTK